MLKPVPLHADPGFGIYVHWPFCLAKCPYCDFNSHVRSEAVDEKRFVAAIAAELRHRASLTKDRVVRSVYFGGGTPSLMKASSIAAILEEIARLWPHAPAVEVTLEANPSSVEAGRFRDYRAAGVNRVSIGVQSFNDTDLKMLGRLHNAAEARAALDVASSVFERYTFDLIYARPQQGLNAWKAELKAALARVRDHLSLYQLTIEPDTIFEKLYKAGKLPMPDADTGRAFWDVTQELTYAAGLPAYEVSNHACPGAESRHNLIYWRYGEYVGVGPGAHGRIMTPHGRRAQATERHPEMWLTVVETDGQALVENEILSSEEQGDEFLLMGLRLSEGIEPARFEAVAGKRLDPDRIASLVSEGMVEVTPSGRLRVSADGFPVLDAVVADLAA